MIPGHLRISFLFSWLKPQRFWFWALAFWALHAQGAIDPTREGYDRYMYVGSGLSLLMSDPNRHATSPVGSIDFYWGSDWSRQVGFEGMVYNVRFREDVERRPKPYTYTGGAQQSIYQHFGIRLRGILYFGDKRDLRLRPIFAEATTFLPYAVLGAGLEPTVAVKDYNHLSTYGSRYWGVGLSEGFGFLQLFRNSALRMRYEGGLTHSFNGQTQGVGFSAFTDPYVRASLEYSFFLDKPAPRGKVNILTGSQLRDSNKLYRFINGIDPSSDVLSAQLGIERPGLNLQSDRKITLLFKQDALQLSNSNYYQLHHFHIQDNPSSVEDYRVVIQGFAPDSGDKEKDYQLARERTLSVQRYFINAGVPIEKIRYSWDVIPENSLKGGKFLVSPQAQEGDPLGEDRVLVQKFIFTRQPPVNLAAAEKKEKVSKRRSLADVEAADRESLFARQNRSLLLLENGLREPSQASKNLISKNLNQLRSGNVSGQNVAIDTQVQENYNTQSATILSQIQDSKNKNAFVVGDEVIGRNRGSSGSEFVPVKSYEELFDLSEKPFRIQALDEPQPEGASFITPTAYWALPFENKTSSLELSQSSFVQRLAPVINLSDKDKKLVFVTAYTSSVAQNQNRALSIARQENLTQALIKGGVPAWRIVDNLFEIVETPKLNDPILENQPPLSALVRFLYQHRPPDREVLQNRALIWLVIQDPGVDLQNALRSRGQVIDVTPLVQSLP